MGTVIYITSGKGGVGKTTCTALLGQALGMAGHRVLLVDADMGMRDLDLALGVQDEAFYTSHDVWRKECSLEDALIAIADRVDFLPASQKYRWEDVKEKALPKLIKRLRKQYDFVLVDGAAGIGVSFEALLPKSDVVLLVVEPSWLSVRDAQRVMEALRTEGHRDYWILLNKVPLSGNSSVSLEELETVFPAERIAGVLPQSDALASLGCGGLSLDAQDPVSKLLTPLVECMDTGATSTWPMVWNALQETQVLKEPETIHREGPLTKMAQALRRGQAWRWGRRGR